MHINPCPVWGVWKSEVVPLLLFDYIVSAKKCTFGREACYASLTENASTSHSRKIDGKQYTLTEEEGSLYSVPENLYDFIFQLLAIDGIASVTIFHDTIIIYPPIGITDLSPDTIATIDHLIVTTWGILSAFRPEEFDSMEDQIEGWAHTID